MSLKEKINLAKEYWHNWLYYHAWASECWGLITGNIKIISCPVCGSKITDLDVCIECWVDPYETWGWTAEEMEEAKRKYREDKAEVGNREWRRRISVYKRETRKQIRADWKKWKKNWKESRK